MEDFTFEARSAGEAEEDAKRLQGVRKHLLGLGLVVMEKGTLGPDFYRVPVRLRNTTTTVTEALFEKVRNAGAKLIAVELFNETQMQSYFVDIPRVRIHGIWRWTERRRRQLFILIIVFLMSTAYLITHVYPFWSQY